MQRIFYLGSKLNKLVSTRHKDFFSNLKKKLKNNSGVYKNNATRNSAFMVQDFIMDLELKQKGQQRSDDRIKGQAKNGHKYSIDMILGKLLTEGNKKETSDNDDDDDDDDGSVNYKSVTVVDDGDNTMENKSDKLKEESQNIDTLRDWQHNIGILDRTCK